MERIKLTPGRIAAFNCPDDKQQVFIRDSDTLGLGVRATVGSKAFIFQSKLSGQSLRMTIGNVDVWTLDAARKEARRLKTLVDAGRDPRVVRDQQTKADAESRLKAITESAPALDAWSVYVADRTPKWSERHKADHESMVREGGESITRGRREGMADKREAGILRPLLSHPLSDITRDRVADWTKIEAARRPTRTRLALSLLATFLNWCSDRPEYRDQVDPDACTRIKRDLPKAKAKDDCLQREQLRLWFEGVGALPTPVVRAYLQFLLLTGARREEAAGLRWDDVDFRWNSIVIRDKVEGERTIPLTPYVKALILELRRINETPTTVRSIRSATATVQDRRPSPWVFWSDTAASGRLQEPRIAHNRALAAAGLPALSIHGLRRSFGTLCEWVECPAGISAQIMGHKPSATAEKHYRRRPIDLLRMWHTKIEAWILAQAGIEQPQDSREPLAMVGGAA